VGKEIVLVIQSKIDNKNVFFTDSNGYQWVRRELNKRPTWDLVVTDPVAGNYYPIVAGIAIVDENKALIVNTDRSVGGSSLRPGQIELMVHRRIFKDDARGVGEPLNELDENGQGIVVTGETDFFFADTHGDRTKVPVQVPIFKLRQDIEFSGVSENARATLNDMVNIKPLDVIPTHVHRVNVPEFCVLGPHDCVLLRVMHREVAQGDPVVIDLSHAIAHRKTIKVTETVLNAGMTVARAAERKIIWSPNMEESPASPVGDDFKVTIRPGDIRTFILETEFPANHISAELVHIETS
jgi:hypothetical protein